MIPKELKHTGERYKSYGMLGKKHSSAAKDKMRLARKGLFHTKEARKKMSEIAKKKGFGKWCKGKKRPADVREKISLAHLGSKNHMWRGDKVGKCQLHDWVRVRFPKTELCECCKKVPPYDLANKGVYDRELNNWEWLCRRCHMVKDGRLVAFKEIQKKRAISLKGVKNG